MCTAAFITQLAYENKVCVLYLVKQAQSLGWSFPKNDSNFELLGRHPSKQVGCYDNPAKRENFMSKQTGS